MPLVERIYPPVFRNIVFPLAEFREHTHVQQCLSFLEKTQWMKPDEIRALQDKKLKSLIHHAYRNVPYYHKVFNSLNLSPEDIRTRDDLKKLPCLTKDIIRKNAKDLVATNAADFFPMEAHSSGTTGEPLRFLITKSAYSIGWAQSFRCWGWGGFRLGDPYVKISPERRSGVVKRIQDGIMHTRFISALDLNEESISGKIREIAAFRPVLIRSYASPMFLMAKYAHERDLDGFVPKVITTTGEKLLPSYRSTIESAFRCKVLDAYGGESTPLAFECDHHEGYHLCEESAVVEILKNGSPANPGEMGEIAFTNLDNYAMPFIRYTLGDLGTFSEETCSCGRGLGLLESIEGRSSDIIITPERNVLVVNFFTDLFKNIPGVDQFQIVQENTDEVTIRIVKNQVFSEKACTQITDEIRKYAGENFKIRFEYPDSIGLTGSGKRRFIISKVPLDVLWK